MNVTYCEDCIHVIPNVEGIFKKRLNYDYARCKATPCCKATPYGTVGNPPQTQFVVREINNPMLYHHCAEINNGACPKFEAKK